MENRNFEIAPVPPLEFHLQESHLPGRCAAALVSQERCLGLRTRSDPAVAHAQEALCTSTLLAVAGRFARCGGSHESAGQGMKLAAQLAQDHQDVSQLQHDQELAAVLAESGTIDQPITLGPDELAQADIILASSPVKQKRSDQEVVANLSEPGFSNQPIILDTDEDDDGQPAANQRTAQHRRKRKRVPAHVWHELTLQGHQPSPGHAQPNRLSTLEEHDGPHPTQGVGSDCDSKSAASARPRQDLVQLECLALHPEESCSASLVWADVTD